MSNDPYLDYIGANWPLISDIYNQYVDYRPIMLIDAEAGAIHALPFAEFVDRLDAASQSTIIEQYHRAQLQRHMVLIVRHASQQIFQSYSLCLED